MEVPCDWVSKLNNIVIQDDYNSNELNIVLDKLIVNLHYKSTTLNEKKNIINTIENCCKRISSDNALLVAKICNLIYNVTFKQKVHFENEQLAVIVPWLSKAIQNFADIAFLDILQVTEVLIKNHPDYFSKEPSDLLNALLLNLENKTTITDPFDVKLARLSNLKAMIQHAPKNKHNEIAKVLLEDLYTLNTHKADIQAKVWTSIIESLDTLCSKSQDFLATCIDEVIGLIIAASEFGFDTVVSAPPKPSTPTAVIIPPQVILTSGEVKAKAKTTVQIKKLSKVKQVNWPEQQNENEMEDSIISRASVDAYRTLWNHSESDQSDSETGQAFRIAKLQARTRHAAFNLLIQIIKVVGCRPLYGHYALLIGKLTGNLRRDVHYKPKITALAAITALLSSSKTFLAQAQHREGGSFTTFSESLAQLVSNLHAILGQLLKSCTHFNLIPPLLHTTAALISVSPYKRLAPLLLTNIFRVIQTYINSKDPAIASGVLLCITEIVILNPISNEQRDILTSGATDDEPCWVFTHCINILKNPESEEVKKIGAWQLLSGLCQCHYDMVKLHLPILEDNILKSLENITDNKLQYYVAKTLDYILVKVLYDEGMFLYRKELWTKLIKGPFIPMAQSPTKIASLACDCLSSLGPDIYHTLPEDLQILVITLVIGCCYSDLFGVRAAAINTLGMFLLFPQMISEQFVHDTKDILIKALKDGNDLVRSRASWSFGNLIELLKNNDRQLLREMSLMKLFEAGISVFNDIQKIKANILRAMANLMLLVTEEDLENNEIKRVVIKSASFFVNCATTGKLMKMRWNACYAIGTMLTNELLYSISNDWLGSIIQNLCFVLLKCGNFKVRINACNALCSIKSRVHFTPYYHFVMTSLLDGLDNAANMTDFREFKHQDDLKQKLCFAICHMISIATKDDVEELADLMNYRFESLKSNMEYFINCAPPEKTSIVLMAANNISNLKSKSSVHKQFLNLLQKNLEVVSSQSTY
ncbi:HEAT repeat-containing protein 6 [Cimex lectularius]|uniref:HEAT repeat-containing protein 6 n=1 Tax=Cimex lectularius TaxID=79782 RepID=A0A8I6SC41_CIMLE|nr:HEAT repeat-containing protein 6 [Cimex lectularius]